MARDTVMLPARTVEVIAECDVLVVGGGPAGVAAAVGAARLGSKVVLVEADSSLGGLGTSGSVLLWPGFVSQGSYAFGGVALEVIKAVEALDGVYYGNPYCLVRHGYANFDAELQRYVLQEMVLGVGVRLLQHMRAIDAVMKGRRIDAVVFDSKSGPVAIRAGVFVDGTGDGDLLAFSGASFRRGIMPLSSAWCIGGIKFDNVRIGAEEPFANIDLENWSPGEGKGFYGQWRRLCKSLGVHVADPLPMPNRHTLWTDGILLRDLDALDPADLTHTDVEGRRIAVKLLRALRAEMPGFEEAFIYQFNTQTGIRVGRLLEGQYTLTDEDVNTHATFEDCVGIGDQGYGKPHFFEIPYRCMLPKEVDNLFATGRCVSATPPNNTFQGAFQEIREIPHCMVTGQAAGVAAAMAAKKGTGVSDVDVAGLQDQLRKQNVLFEPDPSIRLPDVDTKTKVIF